MLFFVGTTAALAQMEKQNNQQGAIQDKMEQEPQPSAQMTQERNARIEAQRLENLRVAKRAEKRAEKRAAKKQAKQAAAGEKTVKL